MCGCLTAVAAFPFLAAIVIGISSNSGGSRNAPVGDTPTIPVVPTATGVGVSPAAKQPIQKSASFDAGYEHGFIVGEARHNNGETGLDSQRLNLMASTNAKSHSEGAADFKSGFIKGYEVGFKGLDRSGGKRPALPKLPILVTTTQTVSTKELGALTSASESPYDVLSSLIRTQPGKDVYVVTAKIVANENYTRYSKYIYDSSRKIFWKMDRSDTLGDNTYSWSVSFDTHADNLSEDGIWGMDSELRQVRSQYGKAKDTIPIMYKKNPAISAWP